MGAVLLQRPNPDRFCGLDRAGLVRFTRERVASWPDATDQHREDHRRLPVLRRLRCDHSRDGNGPTLTRYPWQVARCSSVLSAGIFSSEQ